jgi:hypothetical protein
MADITAVNTAKQGFGPIAWLAVGFAIFLGIARALMWSKGIVNAEVFGYTVSAVLVPGAIAYAFAGRKKVRNGNRFAMSLALLSVLFLLIELPIELPQLRQVAAQERRTAPLVPSDMLEGQRLVDKESGLSILAPDNWVWVWLQKDEPGFRNFAATDPAGGLGFAVNVMPTPGLEWARKNAEDVQIGMAKKLMATGFKVDRRVFESSAVPVSNSYRFVWAIVLPSGERRFRFGYLAHGAKRVVSFTCNGTDEREPEEFTRFVRSAKLF